MKSNDRWLKRMLRSSLGAAAVALPAHAAQPAPAPAPDAGADAQSVARVVVSGAAASPLDRAARGASRLDLSVRETPATLDTIDAGTMQARGYQSAEQAVDSLPGVSSGGAPGSPSQFSTRGFTGDQVTVLRDGIYLGPADMTYRPQNTFNLERVDVLKGPGSVLHGQGAIAGTVDVVSKKAAPGADSLDAVASYGRFDTTQVGVGGNKVLGQALAVRADVSRTSSGGFVAGARADSTNATLSLLWRPAANVELTAGLDVLTDHPSDYFGTPLVPAAFAGAAASGAVTAPGGFVVDRDLRGVNYNVADARIRSTQYLPRVGLRWRAADGVTLADDAYLLYADRKWMNAETYAFDPATRLVERDRFFVFHEQHLVGNRLSASVARPLAGLANRFVLGIDASKLDFVRTRGFPDGDGVDPFHPAAGSFGPLVGRRSPTRWHDTALFAEDALDVTDKVKLVGGARIERFDLVRENYGPTGAFQPATGFERTFHPKNWRLGAVYAAAQGITPYVQFSTGQDPVGANILLVNAGQNFDLSRSRQVEAGVKADFDARRGAITFAAYDIQRRNLLTQTSADRVDTAGMQVSRGFELALNDKPLPAWKVDANLAWTNAGYRNFVDTSNGVDASGNRPANVPRWSANLWNSYGFGDLPLEAGAGLRFVGQRYGNTANTLVLKSYTLLDLYATWRLTRNLNLTGRVNNATNRFYARWADVNYPTQVQLGAPVGYELGLVARY